MHETVATLLLGRITGKDNFLDAIENEIGCKQSDILECADGEVFHFYKSYNILIENVKTCFSNSLSNENDVNAIAFTLFSYVHGTISLIVLNPYHFISKDNDNTIKFNICKETHGYNPTNVTNSP